MNLTSVTMRWSRWIAAIAETWRRGWCMRRMTRLRSSDLRSRLRGAKTMLPNCEVAVLSAAEIAFRWRGLELARARMGAEAMTFRSRQEIVFGVGAEERVLDAGNLAVLSGIDSRRCANTRHPYGPRQSALFRLHPERWLESLVVGDVSMIDERLDARALYSQVPAFSAADRAMIDVLTVTRDGTAGSGGVEGG